MALGIGANTAVFSVVNSVLLKPLDYRDPDRIVTLRTHWKNSGGGLQVSGARLPRLARSEHGVHRHGLLRERRDRDQRGPAAEYARVASVTPEFLRVFDVQPQVGRFFNDEETKPGSAGAVVISDAFWRSHYGAESERAREPVRILGHTMPIVGVLPPRFHFPEKTDLWYPANTSSRDDVALGAQLPRRSRA